MKQGAVAKIIDTLIGWLPDKTQAKIQASRKAVVAGIGTLLTVLTFVSDKFHFLIPPQYAEPVAAVIAFLTTILTYTTPNQLPDVDESGA
jgi:protein-S-isoprenylcysteine O-methyltransferase Ste14